MKRFGLFFILSIVASFFFTSCEKDNAEDDPRFENVGEIRAIIDGKEFISRNATVEFLRYEFVKTVPFSVKIYGENGLGDRMTFHVGNALGTSLLSEAGLVENLYNYNSVIYKQSPENGGKEFSSKNVVPDPNSSITLDPVTLSVDVVQEAGNLLWVYPGTFNYSAANQTEGIINVSDGVIEIHLSEEQVEEYNRLLQEHSDYVLSLQEG